MTPTPILDKNELILKYWPELQPGFLDVLQYSTGDDDISRILTELLTDVLLVWCWLDEEKIQGFFTTKIDIVNTATPQKHLIVDHTYCFPDVKPGSLTNKTAEFLQKYAKSLGCVKIRAYSIRGARYYERVGYKPSYQEWTQEVEHESLQ